MVKKEKKYNYMTLETVEYIAKIEKQNEELEEQNKKLKEAIERTIQLIKDTPYMEIYATALFQSLEIDED